MRNKRYKLCKPAQRESERGIVPTSSARCQGQDNRTCLDGKALQQNDAKGGAPLESVDYAANAADHKATNRPHSKLTNSDRTTALQTKLYQAAVRDKARRFHALHDKLYLPYVLQSAWELVCRNRGAAGIDGVTLKEVEAYGVERFLQETGQAVREKTYRPEPVRRVHIPKPDGRFRPLGIPTVRDRVLQTAAKLVMEPIFEADFEELGQGMQGCSFGFRPGMGPHDALARVRAVSQRGYRWVVDADIEGFFDNLDHQVLMAALRRRIGDGEMLRLIYRWLKAGYLLAAEGVVHDTDTHRGSPQGGPLSPLLANVYLHAFDQASQQQKAFIGKLTRYADDFVIQCGSEQQARRALEWVSGQLEQLKLCLHPTKTRIVNDRAVGFDFLGFHHRRVVLGQGPHGRRRAGQNEREEQESCGVLRWPGRKAQQRLRAEVRRLVGPPGRLRPYWSEVMRDLQAYLRGWCQYYRHGQSTAVFRKLDDYVHLRVARNLARSQPTGQGRARRRWEYYARRLTQWGRLPRLIPLQKGPFAPRCGRANVLWRAV